MPLHNIIVESLTGREINDQVEKSCAPSRVTLMPAIFGRGLDFRASHPSTNHLGGVVAICTFFPETLAEEIQIKGRTARQGQPGIFRLVLCQSDVQRSFAATPEQFRNEQLVDKGIAYEILDHLRSSRHGQIIDSLQEQVFGWSCRYCATLCL
jgi:hypothetical protein